MLWNPADKGDHRFVYKPMPDRDGDPPGRAEKICPLVPEAADATVEFQINAIVDLLEKMKQGHDI